MRKIFVTGIGTGIGKTLVSAILTEALEADYWKPIQCGNLDDSDLMKVKSLLSNNKSKFFEETYCLKNPLSPHAAAELEGITIDSDKFILPETYNHLIIEGAGGLMVPLNDNFLVIDLIKQLATEVVLVSMNYLGSINHTLLSVEALKTRNIPITGIIFNGEPNEQSEKFILEYTGLKCLGRVKHEKNIDKKTIKRYSGKFKNI